MANCKDVTPLILFIAIFARAEAKPDLFNFKLQSMFDNAAPRPPLTFPPKPKNKPRTKGSEAAKPIDEYSFGWGTAPQTVPGSLTVLSVDRILRKGSEHLLRKAMNDENRSDFKAALFRASRALILDLPLARWSMIYVHEVFGHGGRLRSLGKNAGYGFETFGPFLRNAWTETEEGNWLDLSDAQVLSIYAAGMMGTQAAALEIKREILSRDFIHWSFWPAWLMMKLDLTGYFLLSPNPSEAELEAALQEGKDVPRYVVRLSELGAGDRGTVYRKFMAAALWNALDPMVASAFYRSIREYVGYGRSHSINPMYRTKKYHYYLGTRAGLTTASPEFYLDLFAKKPRSGVLIEAYGRGSFAKETGVGIAARNIPMRKSDKVKLRFNADLWSQRELPDRPLYPGFALGGGLQWDFSRRVSVYADAGYKSQGFLMGRADEAGPYLDAGLLIRH